MHNEILVDALQHAEIPSSMFLITEAAAEALRPHLPLSDQSLSPKALHMELLRVFAENSRVRILIVESRPG